MVAQFVLRTDKKDKAGRCPVHLVVYFDGVRLKCATGEKCKPGDWNADRQKFRASYLLAEEANMLLARLAADTLAWWRKLRAAGEAPTVAGL
ncbi:Arm DNA-binding domain-containing protein, partial [Hymenobacter coccineus]|uniref:Arm DNA-binding domain-containing protein n=1 Tax=Hymenobacter coccineus TaxID=1908235 RepID=UPI001EFC23B7